ncbi:hypothetical protein I551_4342 [Mycobacterium ulcerans str. Harvey]|uniref:Uncharacterized protein n=1 Tax=Mycobacterium ulcerans str. Harvey TaxID=1299332 RepID=A0ABP3AHN3_MYCUL|nr:hypothetical protein I551_4342 [Mycobacterium ulcerans str. Harvey]
MRYALIVDRTIAFDNVQDALAAATAPGTADKIVVTFP